MIVRQLKLKPTKKQEAEFNRYLFHLTGVYNWACIKIQTQKGLKKFKSGKFRFLGVYDLHNLGAGGAKLIEINAQVFQTTIKRAFVSWERFFNKISGRPKLKGRRNKLNSFTFPQIFPRNYPSQMTGKINLPSLGLVKFHRQNIPEGKIKQITIIKRASGWYASLVIDTIHTPSDIEVTNNKVGIDTGIKHVAILSDGTKYENPKFYEKSQEQLGKLQRGGNKKKVARKHERIKNQRKEHAEKVSLDIVRKNQEIYITNDDLNKQKLDFGKYVSDAGVGQLRVKILYKGRLGGRVVKLVSNVNSTRGCNVCGNLTGPTGRKQLGVRFWKCGVCGTEHDRDINSAMNTLKAGLGLSLVPGNGVKQETLRD